MLRVRASSFLGGGVSKIELFAELNDVEDSCVELEDSTCDVEVKSISGGKELVYT